MGLPQLREGFKAMELEHRGRLQFLHDGTTRHFRQEGDGPLMNITEEVKAEYHRHIEIYATLIAEIDSIIGT